MAEINLTTIVSEDSLLREIDASSLSIDVKKNGWSFIEHTGNVSIIIQDDLSENLKNWSDVSSQGRTIGQRDLFIQNTDNTGTIEFKLGQTVLPIENEFNIDPTKQNRFFIYRSPLSLGNVNQGLSITALPPWEKNTSLTLSSPLTTSVVVENANPDQLIINLNKASDITDLTGLSLNFTTGTPKTLSSIISGSGTNQIIIQLSGNFEIGDVATLEVLDTNNIITSGESAVYNLDAVSQPIENNLEVVTELYNATFEVDRSPFLAFAGTPNTENVSGGNWNAVSSGGAVCLLYEDITGVINAGDHIRVKLIDLVINSGSFGVLVYDSGAPSFDEEVTAGGSEVIVDIPSFPATENVYIGIGKSSTTSYVFDISVGQVIVERVG